MKIAIIGTHGIGKTTLTYLIAAEGKKRGKNVNTVSEVARSCPFPLNDKFDVDGAQWIISSQINRELTAKAEKYDVLVCDRSAYDPICYLQSGDHPQKSYEKLRWYAEEWLKTYDKIVFVQPSEIPLQDDGVRSLDEAFQMDVHERFAVLSMSIRQYKLEIVMAEDIFGVTDELTKLYDRIFK
ncbi:MAG: ATP-binding protein [Bacteroidetes bacterium]|nr:ATP-binding protein [Bacteroidota bacterium]